MDEFEERDVAIIVTIENGNDTSNQWVVSQLGNFKELLGFKGTTLISIDLAEILVELLKFTLGEVQVFQLLLLLCKLVSHLILITFNLKNNL